MQSDVPFWSFSLLRYTPVENRKLFSFPKENVNCTRLIRGSIVALLFRQAF